MEEVKWNVDDREDQNGVISNFADVMIDPRDGKSYKTVKIGKQTWMAENLDYEMPNSHCYGDDPENSKIYGRLYNWSMAMKAAPNGWHLPSKEEYEELIGSIGHAGFYAAIKSTSGWRDMTGNGMNSSGFSALPGGFRNGREYDGLDPYDLLGEFAGFWTSTRSTRDFDKACIMKIYLNFESAWWHHHLFEFDTANTFFSVRLIKD